MANEFEFGLDIDVKEALKNIEKVNKQIEKMTDKKENNNGIISQNDLNNTIRKLEEARKTYESFSDSVAKGSKQASSPIDSAKITLAVKEMDKMSKSIDEAMRKFRELSRQARINPSAQYSSQNFVPGASRSAKDYRGIGISRNQNIEKFTMGNRSLQQQQRSMEQIIKQVQRGSYLSDKEFKSASGIKDQVGGYKQKGGEYDKLQREIRKTEGSLAEFDKIIQELTKKQSTNGLNKEEKQRLNNSIEMSKVIYKELQAMENHRTKLDQTTKKLDAFAEALENAKVRPDRNSVQGMIHERASSLGIGLFAVTAGTVGSQVMKGTSLKENMLDDNLSVGTQTGNYDYFDVRKNAGDLGRSAMLSETEAIKAQNAYMNMAGYQGQQDLNDSVINVGKFARGSGLTVEQSTENTALLAGNVNGANASSIKGLQQAFSGALKDSGMVGQAEKQLSALNDVVGTIGATRSLSDSDVGNLIAMQSTLAKSGEKSLQGSAGAQFMASIDQGITGSQNNDLAVSAMLQQNPGMDIWGAKAELAKGLNGTAVNDIMSFIDSQSQYERGSEGYYNEMRGRVSNMLGVDMSNERGKVLTDAYLNGDLSSDGSLNEETRKKLEQMGQEELSKGHEGYMGSGSASDKGFKDANESVQTATSDVVSPLKGLVDESLHASGALGTLAIASIALTGAFISMMGSMGIGSILKNGTTRGGLGRGGRAGGTGASGNRGTGSFGGLFGGGGRGNPPGGGSGGAGSGGGGIKGWFGNLLGGGGSGGAEGAGAGGVKAGAKGLLKKLPGVGLIAGGLLGGMELYDTVQENKNLDISDSEKNARVGESVGGTAGGIGGGIAGGALAGSAIGSAFGGIGAIPGAIIGGIGGGIAGSALGKEIGGWFGSLFGSDEKQSSVNKKEDEAVTQKRKEIEEKRAQNIKEDKELLNNYKSAQTLTVSASASQTSVADDVTESSGDGMTSATPDAESKPSKDKEMESNVKDSVASIKPSDPLDNVIGVTRPKLQSSAITGRIVVEHKGEIKGGTSDGVATAISQSNDIVINNARAILPNGNETRIK